MWYIIIGIVAFFVGCLLGCLSAGFFIWGSRQDEEHAASVRIVDGRKKISEAKKTIKDFEEKYQVSFSDFERDLAQNHDERLFDYADWAFWERTLADTQEEVKFQQIIMRE